jgi:4-amino-4-deoxy-L-arabinose transferase-like glycosyltransferase
MRQMLRHQVLIVAAAGVVFFANLGATALWDLDEPLYASIARDMLAGGDWVVPRYNGEVFYDKPPLMFWLIMGGFQLFGPTEFAARFGSAVLAVGTALATYHLGRRLFRAEVGLWGGLVMTSTVVFTVSARAATADSALTFVTTAAMLLFVLGRGSIFRDETRQASSGAPLWTDCPIALTPVHGRSRAAVVGPAFTPGLRGRATLYGYLAALSAALTRLLPRPSRSPVNRADTGSGEVQFPRHACSTRRERRADYRCSERAVNGPGNSVRSSAAGPVVPSFWEKAVNGPKTLAPFVACVLMYALLGLAILAKGPVGLLLPVATMGLFLLIVARRQILRAAWAMRPLTGVAVVAAVALPWYVLVTMRTGGTWLEQFLSRYNLGPFLQPSLGHRGPLFYHFVVILIGLFPWSLLLGPTLVRTYRAIRDREPAREGYVLLACWVGVFFAFWSACSTKLPHYVLPAYPPLALLTGCFIHQWIVQPEKFSRWWLRNASVSLVLVGVGMLAVVPMVAAKYVPGEDLIGLVGLVPVAGGGLCLYYHDWRRSARVLTVFALTSVVFVAAVFALAAVRVDRHQHSKPLVAAIRQDCPATHQIAAYGLFQASMVYYAGGPVPCLQDASQLRRYLDESARPYILTTDGCQAEIEKELPGVLRVVARRPRFLARGEVVVLSPSQKDRQAVAKDDRAHYYGAERRD